MSRMKAVSFRLLPSISRSCQSSVSQSTSTVDNGEIARFGKLAGKWWDHTGEYAALHTMNKLRVPLIVDSTTHHIDSNKPLMDKNVLDVGCGGGILSMPLCRLGASVTGLDATPENIDAANEHLITLNESRLKDRLQFVCQTVEDFGLGHQDSQDIVVASEVVEHVLNLDTFIKACVSITKPGGSLVFTTLNRTQLSYWLAIFAAENIVGIVPKGTHDWDKFVKPCELDHHLNTNGCSRIFHSGMTLNPLTLNWCWTSDTNINYVSTYRKVDSFDNQGG